MQACIDVGIRERPPCPGITYVAGVDSSGGSRDSAVLCIGYVENGVVVVSAIREFPAPHDPDSVADEMCRLLTSYRVHKVTGDGYAARWTSQAFEKRNVTFERSDLTKSALYADLLPRLNARTIRLLDNDRVVNQLCSLERRTTRGGRDSIDHPANGADDLANGIAMLAARFNVHVAPAGAWIPAGPWMPGKRQFVPLGWCRA